MFCCTAPTSTPPHSPLLLLLLSACLCTNVCMYFFFFFLGSGGVYGHVMRLPSNRASQQLLPERERIYLSKSWEAVHGGGSPRPQLEKTGKEGEHRRRKKSCQSCNTTMAEIGGTLHLSFFSLFIQCFYALDNLGQNRLWSLLDLNKGLASLFLSDFAFTVVTLFFGIIFCVLFDKNSFFFCFYTILNENVTWAYSNTKPLHSTVVLIHNFIATYFCLVVQTFQ